LEYLCEQQCPSRLSSDKSVTWQGLLSAVPACFFANVGLGVTGLIQAILESPEQQQAETAGLQVAIALGYAIFTLKENKRMPLGA
jgi:hypothetical protein